MAVTNLTGTKWEINSITCSAGYGQFDIFGTAYDQYGELKAPVSDIFYMYIGYGLNFNVGYYTVANNITINSSPTFLDVGDVLEFDETNAGTDVTNVTLISWLEANGTLIPPAPAGYEVTFVTNGGTSVTKLEDVEELPTPLPTSTKSGYTFNGWYYESNFTTQAQASDTLSANVTLYAKWTLNTYTITFEENGGSTVTDLTEQTNLPSPLPTSTKSGYTFNGWYYESNFTTQAQASDTLSANVTLYAKWTLNTYTITFEENGGSTVTDLTEQTNLPSPLPIPTKANNKFVGWYYDNLFTQKANAGDELTANVTLYAKWYANMSDFYQDVADAIRSKNGETEPIKHTDFAYKIKNIQGAKPEETKTVTPDFSTGNVVVTPTSGKVMSQVTINKDSNLIANNIKKDVTVHGITGSSFIAIELTQAQYDALSVYDDNTYYLIVEV